MLKRNAPSRKRPPPEPATSVDKKKAKEDPPLDPDWDPKEHYEMKREKFIDSKKFKTKQSDYRIKIKPFETDNFGDIRERLGLILQSIVEEGRLMAAPNSMGLTTVTMKGMESVSSTRVANIHDLKSDDVLNKIEAILNSNQEASLEDFKMRFIFTEQPHGGEKNPAFHNRSGPDLDPKVFRARKRALMDVSNGAKDKMCLARCLYVGKHIADNPGNFRNTTKPKFGTINDARGANQKRGAMALHEWAHVSPNNECGLPELQKFQDYLADYQIICFESFSGVTSICFPTEERIERQDKRIYLWLYQNHYTLINPHMLAGFHGTKHFCHNCLQAWDGAGIHKCDKAVCKLCKNIECKNETSHPSDVPVHCNDCNCDFESVHCHKAHKEIKECKKKYCCEKCRKTVPQKNKEPSLHNCLLNKCWYCNQFFEPGEHQCYVQRPKDKKALEVPEEEEDIHYLYEEFNEENGYEDDSLDDEPKKKKYFYCDLECELNEESHDKRHDPILFCMVSEDGIKEWSYYGEDCLQQFFKDINKDADFKNSTFVFHNLSGYDGIHLLKLFYTNCIDPKPLFRGCRVLSMTLPQLGIRFIDSYLHMVIPLSKISDCYGIKGAEKGKFPYNLATKANRDYIGPLPPIEFFDVENMLPEQKAEFLEWYLMEKAKYDADPTKVFNLRKEMLKYCMNDCHVLRKGFTKYRETMKLQYNDLDPADKITLPSYVNHVYRSINMPKDSLAILPPRLYSKGHAINQCNGLASMVIKKYGYQIIHGRNSAEVKVGPYYLDGFTKTQIGGKKVFEYNGCPWHGCPDCYPDEVADTEFRGKTYRQRQMETKDKEEFLEARGYQVLSIYSCAFRRAQEMDPEMKEFVQKIKARLQKATPLAPRDSLRGGRTNAIVMHYVPKEGEEIFYMDFTSLYPEVNCCLDDDQFYPVGFPQIMLDPDEFPPMEKIFGLIKCRILPPKQLFLPVLPISANGKVIFGLCGTCITEGNNTEMCTHADNDRCLEGDFVSMEVQKALELGYVMQEVYEVHHWPIEQRSKTLFRDQIIPSYIKKFQASGWPKAYKTEEERRALLQRYKDEQDIDIPYESVYEIPNPAERSANKLTGTNFWGYLGKQAHGSTVRCTTYEQYLKHSNDKRKTVTNMWMVDQNVLYMELEDKPDFEKVDPKTSVVHATFTTSMARLKLFKEMEKTGRRTLYFDTGRRAADRLCAEIRALGCVLFCQKDKNCINDQILFITVQMAHNNDDDDGMATFREFRDKLASNSPPKKLPKLTPDEDKESIEICSKCKRKGSSFNEKWIGCLGCSFWVCAECAFKDLPGYDLIPKKNQKSDYFYNSVLTSDKSAWNYVCPSCVNVIRRIRSQVVQHPLLLLPHKSLT